MHTVVSRLEGLSGSEENEIIHVGIHPADAIDTTGAVDSYAAGYIHGWLRGWPLTRCADLGARLGALAVSQIGGSAAIRVPFQTLSVSEPSSLPSESLRPSMRAVHSLRWPPRLSRGGEP